MPDVSAVLALPYILPAQAQKHVTHNEALARLDVAVQLAVVARNETLPPPGAETGDRYLVPPGAQNEWAGHEGEIALWDDSTWVFHSPEAGWQAHVLNENRTVVFDGTLWSDDLGAMRVGQLGVNTDADAINRLAVTSPATLLSHEGAGHQLKVNKAGVSDTASLLFQTNWSGRAEMGTAGTDDFAIKVSADGSTWTEALSFDGASGIASGAAVQSAPADTGAGKLARADYVYGPGNLLGTVSESAGLPTGAVVERGSNANGDYVRWADGTQICTHRETLGFAATAAGAIYRDMGLPAWTYPAAFVIAPAVTFVPEGSNWGSTDSNATSASRFLFRHNAASGNVQSTMLAVGRWF